MLPESLRQTSVVNFVLQQMVKHLDPDRDGLAVQIFTCQRDEDHIIRWLWLVQQHGSGVWENIAQEPKWHVGLGSFPARALLSLRIETTSFPEQLAILHLEQVSCAVGYPLLRGGKVAGVLVVGSVQPDHFVADFRRRLVQKYSHLLAQAFTPQEFYAPEQIAFSLLPSLALQEQLLRLSSRILEQILRDSQAQGEMTPTEVEQQLIERLRPLLEFSE